MNREQQVKLFGYALEELPNLKTTRKMDFLNREGKLLPNLPIDPYHLERWRKMGFTPVVEKVATVNAEQDSLVCDVCSAGPFKAKIGLLGHKRTHKN